METNIFQLMLYQKALKLPAKSFEPSQDMNPDLGQHVTSDLTSSQISNHITVDANNILLYFSHFHSVWAVPLKVGKADVGL